MSDATPPIGDKQPFVDNRGASSSESCSVAQPKTPAWKRSFPKPLRCYQFGLADMFLLLTAAAGLFGVLRIGGGGLILLLLGLGVVAVGVSMMDCRNVLVGQMLGMAIGLVGLGVVAILAAPPAEAIGLGVILYAPLCTWMGGVWAGWRQFQEDE